MTTPTFDDLTPPVDLVDGGTKEQIACVIEAARWGARHGYEQARQLWPEPITDRPPTEEDADDRCHVQVLHHCGTWGWDGWNSVAAKSRPWFHTPRWQPRQPSLREQALATIDDWCNDGEEIDVDVIRQALALIPSADALREALRDMRAFQRTIAAHGLEGCFPVSIRRALEQAGEGVE